MDAKNGIYSMTTQYFEQYAGEASIALGSGKWTSEAMSYDPGTGIVDVAGNAAPHTTLTNEIEKVLSRYRRY